MNPLLEQAGGDVELALQRASYNPDLPKTVEQIHAGLLYQFGKASWRKCIRCSRQAKHWAYQYTAGENELRSGTGTPYSENLYDYLPLCISCHRKQDLATDPRLKAIGEDFMAKRRETLRIKEDLGFYGDIRRKNVQEVNKRRRRCLECGKMSNPGGLGFHQKGTGHTGWEDV